jgi:hypothetical protein
MSEQQQQMQQVSWSRPSLQLRQVEALERIANLLKEIIVVMRGRL